MSVINVGNSAKTSFTPTVDMSLTTSFLQEFYETHTEFILKTVAAICTLEEKSSTFRWEKELRNLESMLLCLSVGCSNPRAKLCLEKKKKPKPKMNPKTAGVFGDY